MLSLIPSAEWIVVADPMMNRTGSPRFVEDSFPDFQIQPVDIDHLRVSLGRAYETARRGSGARETSWPASGRGFGLIGSSPAMQGVLSSIGKISTSDDPVVVSGETGTGKELVARAIHGLSRRATGPFVVVNCGAIPETLIQSELFGHSRGAFTSAEQPRVGYLEMANGGTVFLDGIEDLSAIGQVGLLRFLQEKSVTPLGSKDPVTVDVRIIASSKPALMEAVRRGEVREDLYYRLRVLQLDLPPLRDRGTDSVEIAVDVVERFNAEKKVGTAKRLARSALDRILEYPWPGNVRELVGCIRRAAVLSNSRLIGRADLGLPDITSCSGKTLREIKNNAVTQAILRALSETKSVSSAARQLGISRVTLYRLMEKHAIRSFGLAQHGVVED